MTNYIIPLILLFIYSYGQIKGVKLYECFVNGAREGMTITLRIFPYIVAMLLALAMIKSSGALELILLLLKPITRLLSIPEEILPLIIMKPLSGSGSLGILADILKDVGPDSLSGIIASTIMSSTETIFYTITVYYGSIGIKKIRHTLTVALIAELAGIAAAILICRIMFFTSY